MIGTGGQTKNLGKAEDKTYYRRHLPHYQPSGATFFVTMRLAGSLPAEAIERLRQERIRFERDQKAVTTSQEKQFQKKQFLQAYFERFDSLLDGNSVGPVWLRDPAVAEIVNDAIRYRDGSAYELIAHCIMPNHVHIVFEPVGRVADPTKGESSVGRVADPTKSKSPTGRDGVPSYIVTGVLASLKKFTALRANRVLNRIGSFWQNESYDHVVRDDDELERIIWYVLFNPEKAGLVQKWNDWPWFFCKPGLIEA